MMSHWAKVENGIVTQVTVGSEQEADEGYQWLIDNIGGTWIQTSYNTIGGVHFKGGIPLHKNYAGVGYLWDGIGFARPALFPSWTLNAETYFWEAPVAHPMDGKAYDWDEANKNWIIRPEVIE